MKNLPKEFTVNQEFIDTMLAQVTQLSLAGSVCPAKFDMYQTKGGTPQALW